MKKFQSFPTPLPPHAHTLLKCWSQFNIYFWKSMNLLLVLMYFIVRFCVCVCSIQFSSVIQSCLTFCDPMDCRTPDFPVHHQLLESIQTQVHPSLWCEPIISSWVIPFSSCLQSFPASESFQVNQFFPWWPKYWSFSFSISLSTEYSGLICFRISLISL